MRRTRRTSGAALGVIVALAIQPCLPCSFGVRGEAVAEVPGHGHGADARDAAGTSGSGDCATISAPSTSVYAPVSNPPAHFPPAPSAARPHAEPSVESAAGPLAASVCDGIPRALRQSPLRI